MLRISYFCLKNKIFDKKIKRKCVEICCGMQMKLELITLKHLKFFILGCKRVQKAVQSGGYVEI